MKGADVEIVGLGSSFKTTLTGIGTINAHEYCILVFLWIRRDVPQGA
jgi:hypothetical protein